MGGGGGIWFDSLGNRIRDISQGIGRNTVNIVKMMENTPSSSTASKKKPLWLSGSINHLEWEKGWSKFCTIKSPSYNNPYYQEVFDVRNKNQTPAQPANLQYLISSIQNMPGFKIILNFTKNWWDISKKMNSVQQLRWEEYRWQNCPSEKLYTSKPALKACSLHPTMFNTGVPSSCTLMNSFHEHSAA